MQLRQCLHFFTWIILPLMLCTANANSVRPLKPDEAFRVSLANISSDKIIARFEVAKDYYLYRDRIIFSFSPNQTSKIHLPKGKTKIDIDGKPYQAYSGKIDIPILLKTDNTSLKLKIAYQGCSSKGFCYPPMTKTMSVSLAKPSAASFAIKDIKITQNESITEISKDQNSIKDIFTTKSIALTLLIFFGIGLLLSLTPCVLPMIPILTSIVVGQHRSTKKAFRLSLTYVMGSALAYALIGVIVAYMGSSLQVWLQQPFAILTTSFIFVLLGLSLFGLFDIRLPSKLQNQLTLLSNQRKRGHYISVFMMGVISTLIVSPCVTAPLAGALLYISQSGNVIFGASALFALGFGMGLPLLLIGTGAGKLLPKAGVWMIAVKNFFGLMMIAMAIWLLSRILSLPATFALWGLFLLLSAGYLGIYLPQIVGLRALNRGLGVMLASLGLITLASGLSPHLLSKWIYVAKQDQFTLISNATDFQEKLKHANHLGKPVLLDFYADWCASCVAMDKNVFSQPEIKQALQKYVILRADFSTNSQIDNDLLRYFDVIAPPTVIFFDHTGKEMNDKRIVGEVNAKEFLTHL